MVTKAEKSKHGGARPGAGRPPGSLNKRSGEAIEKVAEAFPNWSPLQHFATVANDESLEPAIRLDAAKAAAPFMHPRPKAVEIDPDALVELEARLVQVRLETQDKLLLGNPDLADRLQRAKERVIVVETNVPRAPDDPAPELIEGLADKLSGVTHALPAERLSPPEAPEKAPSASPASVHAGPAPAARSASPAKPAPAPTLHASIPPEPAPLRFSQTMDPNYRPFEN
mgnify:FL=1